MVVDARIQSRSAEKELFPFDSNGSSIKPQTLCYDDNILNIRDSQFNIFSQLKTVPWAYIEFNEVSNLHLNI